ncbi:MAG: Hsp70 family protein [Maritimibacter sp.]|nr:Hsp70 family protein [Maritimibacter sp.]
MPTLAIDFGTSNSAAAVLEGGAPRRIALEAGADTLPTAVFFPADGGRMLIGTEAAAALIEGEDGRYMRALKSVLGTSLLHEARPFGGKRRTLAEVVTGFVAEVKARAEAATGQRFARALSGRPVHFHSDDPARDAQAECDLHACYLAAGFEAVEFRFEPEAAALTAVGLARDGKLGLVVDIGGGTSDFSVFRVTGGQVEIVASHGIRLGGTDFDQALSLAEAMPLLGLGGQLTRTLGEGLLPVPKAIYVDLATWAKIPFLYSRDTERTVEDLVRHAVEPEKLRRLETTIRERHGHALAFAVEAGKIGANGGARAGIDMGMIAPGLSHPVTPGALAAALAPFRDVLRGALYATLMQAGTAPAGIGTVVLVGGSSLMGMIGEVVSEVCPGARQARAQAFTAVVDGLALASA